MMWSGHGKSRVRRCASAPYTSVANINIGTGYICDRCLHRRLRYLNAMYISLLLLLLYSTQHNQIFVNLYFRIVIVRQGARRASLNNAGKFLDNRHVTIKVNFILFINDILQTMHIKRR